MYNKSDQKIIVLGLAFGFFIISTFALIFFGIKIFLGPGLSQFRDYIFLFLTIIIFIVSLILSIKNRKVYWSAGSKKLNKMLGLFVIILGIIFLIINLSYHKSDLIYPTLVIISGILSLRRSRENQKPTTALNVKKRSRYVIIVGIIFIIIAIFCWDLPYQEAGYKWIFLSIGIGTLFGGLTGPHFYKKQIEAKKK